MACRPDSGRSVKNCICLLCVGDEVQERVRAVLAALQSRQAELLVLRSHGFSYEELALSLDLNPVSVGTLLGRAQQAFRKEYVARYGQELLSGSEPLGRRKTCHTWRHR
jgi:DNA-binding CsgD family transcriptional regulator